MGNINSRENKLVYSSQCMIYSDKSLLYSQFAWFDTVYKIQENGYTMNNNEFTIIQISLKYFYFVTELPLFNQKIYIHILKLWSIWRPYYSWSCSHIIFKYDLCTRLILETQPIRTLYNVLSLLIGQFWNMSKRTHTQMFYDCEAWFLAVVLQP